MRLLASKVDVVVLTDGGQVEGDDLVDQWLRLMPTLVMSVGEEDDVGEVGVVVGDKGEVGKSFASVWICDGEVVGVCYVTNVPVRLPPGPKLVVQEWREWACVADLPLRDAVEFLEPRDVLILIRGDDQCLPLGQLSCRRINCCRVRLGRGVDELRP